MRRIVIAMQFWIALALAAATAHAEGTAIEHIETPYAHFLEQEIEYNALYAVDDDDGRDGAQQHEISYGRALAERWFGEIEAAGVRDPHGDLAFEAFAVELKYQLTEQGEYSTDWGWLTELERNTADNAWEFSNMLIAAHDWGRWTGIANLALSYEWGDSRNGKSADEVETRFAAQLKYRRGMDWEPALELHLGEHTRGLGPVFSGAARVGQRKKFLWEAGAIVGLDRDTPDLDLKLNLEYEF